MHVRILSAIILMPAALVYMRLRVLITDAVRIKPATLRPRNINIAFFGILIKEYTTTVWFSSERLNPIMKYTRLFKPLERRMWLVRRQTGLQLCL